MGRRILNDALTTIVNAEKRGFASAQLKPISNVMANFLQIMKYRGWISFFALCMDTPILFQHVSAVSYI
ncbi:unnamed protein product [Cuscuta campestris]|uniref:30S ribosomal protein S8, chloroplastic n=1 Tax=Cuscuta campestris TaxID=132261 RepID=A0A484NCY9_9ASTE|nr:unnamed protein product [Cuscuta campestris]